jgi:hypothetical protein
MSFFPPQCLWTTVYSNLLQNVRELHCLREIQITREVALGAKKKGDCFFPAKKKTRTRTRDPKWLGCVTEIHNPFLEANGLPAKD